MEQQIGHFVISLDFELMWGVRDTKTIDTYGNNLRGVQEVIPKTLALFKKFDIRGTFAVVGILFFDTKNNMLSAIPEQIPKYKNQNLSPYGDYMLKHVGENYTEDSFHFAPHLIKLIHETPGQEIGTHTFSHYYCLEGGQTKEDFKKDIDAAIEIAGRHGVKITSIVFPRNQFNKNYLDVCKNAGIFAYRNNERSRLYEAKGIENETSLRRVCRLADAYFNITGYHCYTHQSLESSSQINVPSSRFLRPYSPNFKLLESFRMHRIKNAMTHAAKNKLIYHLWWHPHNFGINQDENFAFLNKILLHYKFLNVKYGFSSITMSDLAKQLLKRDGE